MTLHLSSLTLSLVLVMPLVAHAGDRAQPHIAKAMEAHKAGNFTIALAELQQAYSLEPRPELLFAIGQVNVKLDRCADAIGYYEKYLATKPSAQATADTNEAITTCKTQLAAAPPPPAPVPPPASTTPVGGRRPWYSDKLGDGLVLAGLTTSAIGVVLYVGARGDLDDAESAMDLSHYQDAIDRAHEKRTWSVILVGGGVALIGAGVAHYMLGDRSTETRGVGVVPTRSGGLVTWGGSF